ncbi:hypothetical protein SNEBB_009275 [Seison nebaliae]|nr:hypothetical protein SNEBB_009275 [Seison nebaliae]
MNISSKNSSSKSSTSSSSSSSQNSFHFKSTSVVTTQVTPAINEALKDSIESNSASSHVCSIVYSDRQISNSSISLNRKNSKKKNLNSCTTTFSPPICHSESQLAHSINEMEYNKTDNISIKSSQITTDKSASSSTKPISSNSDNSRQELSGKIHNDEEVKEVEKSICDKIKANSILTINHKSENLLLSGPAYDEMENNKSTISLLSSTNRQQTKSGWKNYFNEIPEVISLNVGGTIYTTALSTLQRFDNSMLNVMFTGKYKLSTDSMGNYFIDRDGRTFGHILNYLRCNELPPESVAPDVYREAEFYCLNELVERLEILSPRVITMLRYNRRSLNLPDYDCVKLTVIECAKSKMPFSNKFHVALTQKDNSNRLKGTIPCFNCARELVHVDHTCTFEGVPSDISLNLQNEMEKAEVDSLYHEPQHQQQAVTMENYIEFLIDDLKRSGFDIRSKTVVCKFSVRCSSCTLSGLYTAGGILAPRECPNMAYLLSFNWNSKSENDRHFQNE